MDTDETPLGWQYFNLSVANHPPDGSDMDLPKSGELPYRQELIEIVVVRSRLAGHRRSPPIRKLGPHFFRFGQRYSNEL
jgi:hypothetical protein